MSRERKPIELLVAVGSKLARLPKPIAFVGGATTGLLVTDPAAPPPRSTLDVDVILDVEHYTEYTNLVAPALRRLGAHEDDSDGAPLCRWILDDVVVDVMPVDSSILGFTNRWYRRALATARTHRLPDGTDIRVLDAPHFVATKIEAFQGRGSGDFLASKDLEDILTVVDGRAELVEEIEATDPDLRAFLHKTFAKWLLNRDFRDAVLGFSPDREEIILARIEEMQAERRLA